MHNTNFQCKALAQLCMDFKPPTFSRGSLLVDVTVLLTPLSLGRSPPVSRALFSDSLHIATAVYTSPPSAFFTVTSAKKAMQTETGK